MKPLPHEKKGKHGSPVTCGDWLFDNRLGLASGTRVKISKPLPWTPDRMVNACQSCKLPFNKADPKRVRKHHCRHCGRCICSECSKKMAIPKFGDTKEERVCLLCERVLTETPS